MNLKCVNCGHEWEQHTPGVQYIRENGDLRGPVCDLCFHLKLAVDAANARRKPAIAEQIREIHEPL